MGQVYKVSFESTSKVYIGITTRTAKERMEQHLVATRANSGALIHRAIRKHTGLVCEVIAEADEWKVLCELEVFFINKHNSYGDGGYNLTQGGDGLMGYEWTDEDRDKAAAKKWTGRRLTIAGIKALEATDKPYKKADARGLYVLIHPSGGKYFRFAYRFDGKQKTLAIGVFGSVSLEQAREKAEDARKQIAAGIDPMAKKKNIEVRRFGKVKPLFSITYASPMSVCVNYTLSGAWL